MFLRNFPKNSHRLITECISPNRHKCTNSSTQSVGPIVTLLDALSDVGQNLALLLKQNPLIKELRLYDETESTFKLVQDLCLIDTNINLRSFGKKFLKDAVEGAHIVISTGGCQCKPCQTSKDLFVQNLDNIRNVAIYLSEFNPDAIYCISKSPVEALVPAAVEEYKRSETFNPQKIIGITTPVSMIVNTLIAKHLNTDPGQVLCPIIGGMSHNSVVPVISQTKPNMEQNPDLSKKLQEAIISAESNLVKKGATFCYSKAVAISRFVNLLLRAYHGDSTCVECAFVPQVGHIGDYLSFMTSIVRLGREGILSTHMPKINDTEISQLKAATPQIVENILLGQTFLYGDYSIPKKYRTRKSCNMPVKYKLKQLECQLRKC